MKPPKHQASLASRIATRGARLLWAAVAAVLFTVPAFAQSVTVQASGVAPVQSTKQAAVAEAVRTARWLAVKKVLGRVLQHGAEDDAAMAPVRTRFEANLPDYVEAEFILSEDVHDGLAQVSVSVKLNERRLVADVNAVLSEKSGGAVKPRVLLLLEGRGSGILAGAMAEELNARGVFDIKDKAILNDIVNAQQRKKMDAGELTPEDIEAIRTDSSLRKTVDFLVSGWVRAVGAPTSATVSAVDFRVIDLANAQVLATVTDSAEADGATAQVAASNASVKLAKVLTPRLLSQVMSRWRELTQITVLVHGGNWFSKPVKDLYEKVLKVCLDCRGTALREKGPDKDTAQLRLAFRGSLYAYTDALASILERAGEGASIGEVHEDSKVVELNLGQ